VEYSPSYPLGSSRSRCWAVQPSRAQPYYLHSSLLLVLLRVLVLV